MTDKPLKNPFRDPTMTAQNPNASAIPTRTVGPKVHSFQLSVFPREGFCASKECMGAIPRKLVELVEEKFTKNEKRPVWFRALEANYARGKLQLFR